jgi:hypothetical protein
MKKYKGLVIPETQCEEAIVDFQDSCCLTISCNGDCKGVECEECLYYSRNIETFKEWLKEKE